MTENFSEESGEYLSLWREAGVELPPGDGLRRRLETWLAAAVAPAPAPGATPRTLGELSDFLGDCRRCKLCDGRRNVVFGAGPDRARLMFVGEGPGHDEDVQGVPFVGRAGQLLTKIIEAMGQDRSQVYIANVVKCLRYNTLVQLENGSWERIGRLVLGRYSGKVMSVDSKGAIVPRRVIGWHTSPLGDRRVLRVSYASSALRGGHRAVTYLTHDHEVLTRRGWIRGELLRPDDEVAVGQGMSREALEVTIGSLLGDGTISRRNAHLAFGHCRDQREYVEWKARALQEIGPIVHDDTTAAREDGVVHLTTRCRTRATRALRVLQSHFYDSRGKKRLPAEFRLSPRILAIWFLDDGHTRIREGRAPVAEIAAHSFGAQDLQRLCERLLSDLRIEAYQRESSLGRIHFDTEATKKLLEIVAPYCPPCLRYKLDPNTESRLPFNPRLFEGGVPETLFDRVFVEPVDFLGTDKTFFCLDVEETHSFVTSGGVVHNCRPPQNRTPEPDEVAACLPFLKGQVALIRPQVIVALGATATSTLVGPSYKISAVRGTFQRLSWDNEIEVMPTFHPAYLLRNPEAKKMVWEDMKKVMARLGDGGTAG